MSITYIALVAVASVVVETFFEHAHRVMVAVGSGGALYVHCTSVCDKR